MRFSSIFVVIYLFIIIFPVNIKINNKLFEKIEKYIEDKKYNFNKNVFLIYLWIIILSPFLIKKRFLKLNKYYRRIFFFLVIYPIFFPIYFFDRINGKISFAFNVFIVIGDSIQYENWVLQITYSYYLFIIFPTIIYLTSVKYKKVEIIFFVNLIIDSFLLFLAFSMNFLILGQSTTYEYLFFTPYFIILIICIIIITKFTFTNIEEKEESEIGEEMIEK